MPDGITFVNVGAASSTDGGSAPAPTNPVGIIAGDFKLLAFYGRDATDGTVVVNTAGWTQVVNQRDSDGGLIALWYKFDVAGPDAAPTFTLGNFSGGASGDDCNAQIAAFRGVKTTDPIRSVGLIATGGGQQNIGPITGVVMAALGAVVAIAGKRDDWTSVATLIESGVNWFELGEPDSTAGADSGLVWDYALNPAGATERLIGSNTFVVTGGAVAGWKGFMVSLNPAISAFTAATDIVLYCSQSHPETDVGIAGGLIDRYMRANFTNPAAADDIEVLSNSVSDNVQSVTLKGRTAAGALVTETKTLNGTTAVIFSTAGVIERVISVKASGFCTGTLTVRRSVAGTTVGTIPPGELGFRMILANAYSNALATKDYYEKIHARNNHLLTTMQNVSISESADPSGKLTFTLDAAKNDDSMCNSRTSVPATVDINPSTFSGTAKGVPTSFLSPGDSIGIWLKLTLPAADPSFFSTYTLQVSGGTSP